MRTADAPPALPDTRRTELLLLAALLVVSLLLNFTGLWWGLPNGDVIWATDALTPMTPLAVAHHLLSGGWNSGWFFYKYPLGHPLLLAVIYAPYMLWLKVSGGLGRPAIDYPYGFTNPEQALLVLGVLGRSVSALMTTAATLVWYGACREVFDRRTAWLAAWFFATMFPIVYYAHTTNVDGPLVFWCVLALYGAARVYSRGDDRVGMVIFGGAAAMALSTKEYAVGLVLTLPVILLVDHLRRRRQMPERAGLLPSGTLVGFVVAVVVFAVMNGAFINPLGLWRRAHFLTDSMPEALRLQYAPRFSHVGSAAPKGLATELAQIGETLRLVAASIGWPLAIAAAISSIAYGWRRPAAFFVIAAAGYYLVSLRTLEMLHPRYVLPLCVLASALAAFSLEWARLLRGATGRRLLAALTGVFVVYGGARGVDTTRLLRDDSRYAAEEWLQANATPDTSIEVYQREAYLPRFPSWARLATVPFDQISIPDFLARQPDLVVLSSAGLAGVTAKFKNDLQSDGGRDQGERVVSRRGSTGEAMAFEYTRNRAFLDALEGGCLGYVLVARFETTPWVAEPTIPSLAPEIRVYQRRGPGTEEATATARADRCRQLLRAEASGAADGRNGG